MYKSEDEKVIKRVPEFFKERLRMKKKMETDEGRNIYNLRKIVVEPVIGNIKYNLGFSEFSVRGLNGARLELNIASIAHNLKKIWKLTGKISKNNENLFFEFIIHINYFNYGTACLGCGGCHISNFLIIHYVEKTIDKVLKYNRFE